jgi:hypothetical protein
MEYGQLTRKFSLLKVEYGLVMPPQLLNILLLLVAVAVALLLAVAVVLVDIKQQQILPLLLEQQ